MAHSGTRAAHLAFCYLWTITRVSSSSDQLESPTAASRLEWEKQLPLLDSVVCPKAVPIPGDLRVVSHLDEEKGVTIIRDDKHGPKVKERASTKWLLNSTDRTIERLCSGEHPAWAFCPQKQDINWYRCENRAIVATLDCAFIDSTWMVNPGMVFDRTRVFPFPGLHKVSKLPILTANHCPHHTLYTTHTLYTHSYAIPPYAVLVTLLRNLNLNTTHNLHTTYM
jgi:hypothetical protein